MTDDELLALRLRDALIATKYAAGALRHFAVAMGDAAGAIEDLFDLMSKGEVHEYPTGTTASGDTAQGNEGPTIPGKGYRRKKSAVR